MGEGMDHIVLYLTLILDTRDSFLRTFSHFVFSSPLHNIHKILFNLHKIYNIRNRAEMTVIHTCQPHVIHASIISQNQLAHPVAIILGKLFVSLLDVHIEKKRKKERKGKKRKGIRRREVETSSRVPWRVHVHVEERLIVDVV